MGLLAEMKVGNQHVLGEVHRQIAQEDVRRRAEIAGKDFGKHVDQHDGEHETGAERDERLDQCEAPSLPPHDSPCTDQVGRRSGDSQQERVQASSFARVRRESRVFRRGSSSTRSISRVSTRPSSGPGAKPA